jgi:Protein of unknown function (DUF1615)
MPEMSLLLARAPTIFAIALLAGCGGSRTREQIDPDVARAAIQQQLPKGVNNASAWAQDIFAAFEALNLPPTRENVCAAIAVTQQESTFQANPPVPGVAAIARREIDTRANRYHVPKFVVNAALGLESPNGKTYADRLKSAKTEQELSEIFEDFIGIVPLGRQLFADFNPVRTGGPMQVSIAFAEEYAGSHRYPYPVPNSIRREVFTRRGGMYFGVAHLLDYPVEYDAMLYRFADFNAGHYASRNAAFQRAVSIASKATLAIDGDLIIHGSSQPGHTELATRKLADRIEMSHAEIRRDLEKGLEEGFAESKLYRRVFELADKASGHSLPRAAVPNIRLKSGKITRNLTTEWFAQRVNTRYKQCLARSKTDQ